MDQIPIDDKNESKVDDIITEENNRALEILELATRDDFATNSFGKRGSNDIIKTDRKEKNEFAIDFEYRYRADDRIEKDCGNKIHRSWESEKEWCIEHFLFTTLWFEFVNDADGSNIATLLHIYTNENEDHVDKMGFK